MFVSTAKETRRGIILLIVLALLTLFAIVGVSFVMYAGSMATSARNAREAETQIQPDMDPELLFSWWLSKFIFDEDDVHGVYSAMRGHSVARTMFGQDANITQTPTGQAVFQTKPTNTVPYNGIGRLHHGFGPLWNEFSKNPNNPIDEWQFPNYTYHAADKVFRDPERHYFFFDPANPTAPPVFRPNPFQPYPANTYVPFNASYTYPDLNNMFLGAVKAGGFTAGGQSVPPGAVLTQSFHRNWLFGGTNPVTSRPFLLHDQNNPNWRNPLGKYKILRPRPHDQLLPGQTVPEFPYPEDAGGDVKNLRGSPGLVYQDDAGNYVLANNDSIWMDLGAPVMVNADGTKYKPLFAPLIIDLDNRVNLNVHGNIRAQPPVTPNNPNPQPNTTHLSNEGWGLWEVNLEQVLNRELTLPPGQQPRPPFEWTNLFRRFSNPTMIGRYGGVDMVPPPAPKTLHPYGFPITQPYATQTASAGTAPHFYASVDLDACTGANFVATSPVKSPTAPNAAGDPTYNIPAWFFSPFPAFPPGYLHLDNTLERQRHPMTFNFFNPQRDQSTTPATYDSVLPISNMEALLRYGETNSPGLTSELYRSCGTNFDPTAVSPPNVFDAARRRQLVTTHSFGYDRAGVTAWAWNPNFSGPNPNYPNPSQYHMPGIPDTPDLFPKGAGPIPFPNLAERQTGVVSPGSEFQPDWRAVTAAIRRVDLNRHLTPYPPLPKAVPMPADVQYGPYDTANAAQMAQVNAAQNSRQQFAQDIFMVLVEATGAYNLPRAEATPPPTLEQAKALRWLAQLAVNIVDYIDSDDIMTRFTWTATDVQGHIAANHAAEVNSPYVFGTELPRVVLNEVYAEYKYPTPTDKTQADVDVWIEMHNPFLLGNPNPDPNDPNTGPQDKLGDAFVLDRNRGTAWLHWPKPAPAPKSNFRVMLCKADQYVTTSTTGGQVDKGMRQPLNVFGSPEAAYAGTDLVLRDGQGNPCIVDNFHDPAYSSAAMILPADGAYTTNGSAQANIQRANNGFYVLGPQGKPFPNNNEQAQFLPVATHSHPRMTFRMQTTDPDGGGPQEPVPQERFMIVLQRLANPYLPADDAVNPWITIDYINTFQMSFDPHNRGVEATNIAERRSLGRTQPYRASPLVGNSYVAQNPTTSRPRQPKNSFFRHNGAPDTPTPTLGTLEVPFLWLPHLDRQLISPMELLSVSAYKPHELLQQFHTPMEGLYAHRAPWFDQTTRLYRAFEFLHTHSRAAGVASGGRLAGQINLNTVWDEEILQALCDAQQGNAFTAPDVSASFARLLQLRSATAQAAGQPPYLIGGDDRPFLGMGAGYAMGDGTFQVSGTPVPLGAGIDSQHPTRGTGINDTFLRSASLTADTMGPEGGWKIGDAGNTRRLFNPDLDSPEAPTPPPLRDQMLTKLFNNVTTRSNVFAVWVTVGFFRVTDDSTRPVKLGAEIGKAEGRNKRHRLFAIVDRTNLTIDPVTPTLPGGPPICLSAEYYVTDPQSPPSDPPWFHIAGATYVNGSTEPDGLRGLVGYYEGHRWKLAFDPSPGGANSTWVTTEYGLVAEDPTIDTSATQWKVAGVAEAPGPGGVPIVQFVNPTGTPFVPHSSPFLVMPGPGPAKLPPRPGNPGPQSRFNPREYPWVVRYFSIIQ